MSEDKLTDEQAEEMLKRLSKHYRSPVMPLSKYCNALRTWANTLERKARAEMQEMKAKGKLDTLDKERLYRGSDFRFYLDSAMLNIRKSNMLYRLLYLGQKLRTEECPTHKGRWGDIFSGCECGGTGWLPHEDDKGEWTQGVQLVTLKAVGVKSDD